VTAIAVPVNARSRRTRATLLSAARELLEEDGFGALTMAAVADRAGVTRRAVYLHFASRAELVAGLFDHVAGEEGLEQSLARVWDAPDAAAALDEWARHLARYHTRLLAVDRAVERVRRDDADAARHRERVVQAKLSSCRRLAQRLADEQALAPAWSTATAADVLFALTSSDVVEGLTVDRRWSRQKLADHLGLLLRSTFLKPTHERS
jgi:AcrR family transcriptional regulator